MMPASELNNNRVKPRVRNENTQPSSNINKTPTANAVPIFTYSISQFYETQVPQHDGEKSKEKDYFVEGTHSEAIRRTYQCVLRIFHQ